MSRHFSCN